jgi:hypothetical protein
MINTLNKIPGIEFMKIHENPRNFLNNPGFSFVKKSFFSGSNKILAGPILTPVSWLLLSVKTTSPSK